MDAIKLLKDIEKLEEHINAIRFRGTQKEQSYYNGQIKAIKNIKTIIEAEVK